VIFYVYILEHEYDNVRSERGKKIRRHEFGSRQHREFSRVPLYLHFPHTHI